MNDYNQLIFLMERIIHKYNEWENKKRDYGTGILLSKSEIHTVVAIGDNQGINVTSLSKYLSITKGAASQMIYKLVDKGLVEKKVSPSSDTEVVLSLTKDGRINYDKHNELHKEANDESIKILKTMPKELYDYMFDFFTSFEGIIDNKLSDE